MSNTSELRDSSAPPPRGRGPEDDGGRGSLYSYRRLLEEISDYIYFVRHTGQGRTETIHGAGCESITGYTAEELSADPDLWLRTVPAEDRPRVEEQLASVQSGRSTPSLEHRLRRKDGRECWVLRIVLAQFDSDGRYIGHDGLLRDVTARKLAEEREQNNQRLFIGLVDAAMDAIVSVNERQRIILFNPAAEKMFGLSAADALGQPLEMFIPERYRATHADHIRRFAQTGASNRRMGELGRVNGVRANGEEFPIEASISRLELGAEQVFTVILRDITQRVRAEADTAALANLVASSDDAILGQTVDGFITSWNAGAERIFGIPAADAVGRHVSFLAPAARYDEEREILAAVNRGEKITHFETQRLRAGGELIDVSLTVSPIRDASGRITGISKIARDISGSKRAQQRLRASEEKYRRFFGGIIEAAAICRVLRDDAGTIVDWVPIEFNTAAFTVLGDQIGALLGRPATEFLEPDDAAERVRRLHAVMSLRQADTYEASFGGVDFLTTMFPLDENLFVTTGIDITARKRAEAELLQLNQELEQRVEQKTREVQLLAEAVANLSEGVLITDFRLEAPGPKILFANRAMCRISGYSMAELLGQSPRVLQGELTERAMLERVRRELGAGRACEAELTYYRKDGTTYQTELFISPLSDAAGERTNFIAIHRDISERKRLEQHVLEATSDEQRRIGLELHDGTSQQLTGLGLQAGTLRELVRGLLKGSAATADPALHATLVRMSSITHTLCLRLAETQRHVQDLSRGIMPVQVDVEGLRSALEELASATSAPPYVRCEFECSGPVRVADNHTANHLYRIAQEAVNNALRHSRADEISIRLAQEADQLVLEVSDKGAGMESAPGTATGRGTGMGLRIMEYRAGMIGGSLQIATSAKEGTRVRCTVYVSAPII